jgi:hypothetical protein
VRIVTLNLNGIRSAASKGAFDWLRTLDADILCLQETKAQVHQHDGHDVDFRPTATTAFSTTRVRPGYSGVALYSKRKPDEVMRGFGVDEFDARAAISRRASAICRWCRSTCRPAPGPERQASKFRFLEAFMPWLRGSAAAPRLRPVRRLEHRAQADRPEELEIEPEELRLPARGARLARPNCSATSATSTRSARSTRARPVHLVVQPRPGLGQERRLAHRLPGRSARLRGAARAPTSTRRSASPTMRRS